MTRSQVAADAAATVNGLAVTSASNTLANIVGGLTLTLSAPTTAPVTVNVVADNDTLKKTLTDFAAAYTSVYKLIAADTKYDATSKQGGILQGDSAAVGLQNQLRTLAGGLSGASSAFGRLSDAGLQIQARRLDDGQQHQARQRPGQPARAHQALQRRRRTPAEQRRLRQALSRHRPTPCWASTARSRRARPAWATSCSATRRTRTRCTTRLAGIEKRLRAQYTALDTQMASLSTQSSYITQQVAAWNSNKS